MQTQRSGRCCRGRKFSARFAGCSTAEFLPPADRPARADPGTFRRRLMRVLQRALPGTARPHHFDIQSHFALVAEQHAHGVAGVSEAEIGQLMIGETGAAGRRGGDGGSVGRPYR